MFTKPYLASTRTTQRKCSVITCRVSDEWMDGRMDALFTNVLALLSDRLHSLIPFSSAMSGTIRPRELADFYWAPSPGDALVEVAPISACPSPVALTNQNPGMYHMTRSSGRRKAAFLSTLWVFWNILPSNWRASPLPWQQSKSESPPCQCFPLSSQFIKSLDFREWLTSIQSFRFISYSMSNQEKQKGSDQSAIKKKWKKLTRRSECHGHALVLCTFEGRTTVWRGSSNKTGRSHTTHEDCKERHTGCSGTACLFPTRNHDKFQNPWNNPMNAKLLFSQNPSIAASKQWRPSRHLSWVLAFQG